MARRPRRSDAGEAPRAEPVPSVGLALQGGGAHGAFTWGVLDRLLDEIEQKRLSVAAISCASAGAINAALFSAGLARGGPAGARQKLRGFWAAFSRRGWLSGNALFGYGEPNPLGGWNIDWNPLAITMEAMSLVLSPYANPFYSDPLRPLLEQFLLPDDWAALNRPGEAIPVFISATDVRDDTRRIFTQPSLDIAALRASAALPTTFRAAEIKGVPYWDGGYLGNPPLSPLLDLVPDILLVMINPLHRSDMPPRSGPAVQERINELIFNASVVLELNGIEAVNRVLSNLAAAERGNPTKYRPIRFHLIRDERFLGELGMASKFSTSWSLLQVLFEHGRARAGEWLRSHLGHVGRQSSCDVHAELIAPMLKGDDIRR